jgi:hypothetical protein
VILSDSKEQHHNLIREIKAYAHQELRLNVKENWQIFPTFVRGLDFLGYLSWIHPAQENHISEYAEKAAGTPEESREGQENELP